MEKDITALKLALNLSDSHEKQVLLIEKNSARAISIISVGKLLLKKASNRYEKCAGRYRRK